MNIITIFFMICSILFFILFFSSRKSKYIKKIFENFMLFASSFILFIVICFILIYIFYILLNQNAYFCSAYFLFN